MNYLHIFTSLYELTKIINKKKDLISLLSIMLSIW